MPHRQIARGPGWRLAVSPYRFPRLFRVVCEFRFPFAGLRAKPHCCQVTGHVIEGPGQVSDLVQPIFRNHDIQLSLSHCSGCRLQILDSNGRLSGSPPGRQYKDNQGQKGCWNRRLLHFQNGVEDFGCVQLDHDAKIRNGGLLPGGKNLVPIIIGKHARSLHSTDSLLHRACQA